VSHVPNLHAICTYRLLHNVVNRITTTCCSQQPTGRSRVKHALRAACRNEARILITYYHEYQCKQLGAGCVHAAANTWQAEPQVPLPEHAHTRPGDHTYIVPFRVHFKEIASAPFLKVGCARPRCCKEEHRVLDGASQLMRRCSARGGAGNRAIHPSTAPPLHCGVCLGGTGEQQT
jgi:hypothetical protein